ncbi:MAG: SCO family protein [Candidatus Heimdallarchaeota archaeon]|nr:SCO family protein [Candidatus Heimdallarchaeota archaeon]MDH5645749.1 SCO family protein [Candidatus Heimdallarchaeota archaeon]
MKLNLIGLLIIFIVLSFSGFFAYDYYNNPGAIITGKYPDFSLTNFNNESITFSDYSGKVRMVTFVYTVCAYGCNLITTKMTDTYNQLVDKGYDDDIAFFVIDFDYLHDNLTTLQNYASSITGIDELPDNYQFITGNEEQINQTALEWGFYYELEKSPLVNTTVQLSEYEHGSVSWIHAFIVYIIDQDGQIRHYLHGTDWIVEDAYKVMRYLIRHGS